MKQLYAILALTFVCPLLSSAQYLADNYTAATPLLKKETSAIRTQWEKEEDRVNGSINKKILSKMKAVTESVVAFFQDSVISEQAVPVWHGEYFSEKTSASAQIRFGALCNFHEQKASLSIIANDISPLLDHFTLNNQDFLTIQPATAVKNNGLYFEYTEETTAAAQRTRVWLVTTSNEKLPYTPVTRKEYLQQAIAELNTTKNGIIAVCKQRNPVRPADVQEAEKKAVLEQLSAQYSGADLEMRSKALFRNYKTDEQYLKENIEKETADVDGTIQVMENILSHLSTTELDKPAIVSASAAGFQGFEDGLASGRMLIRVNPTYFDLTLSGEKPQVFLVSWSYKSSNAAAAAIDQQIQEHLDCQKLREMLGK